LCVRQEAAGECEHEVNLHLILQTLLGRILPAGEPAQQPSLPKAAQLALGQGTGAAAAARSAPSPPPPPPRPPGAGSKPSPKPRSAPSPPPPPPPPRPAGSGQRPPAPRLAIPTPPHLPPLQHTPAPGQASSPTIMSEQPQAAGGAAAQHAGKSSSSAGQPIGTTDGAAQPSGALAQGSKSAKPGTTRQQDSPGINGGSTASPANDEDKTARENAPEYCTAILTLLKVRALSDGILVAYLLFNVICRPMSLEELTIACTCMLEEFARGVCLRQQTAFRSPK
jgi:hypothetical protein